VRGALREAAGLGPPVASIAMPVFASGNGRFDFERGLNVMLDQLTHPAVLVPPRVVFFCRHPDRAQAAIRFIGQRFGSVETL